MPNRLIHETSPYLRKHAHNPVDWYPWSEEALARARSEDKPLLLSIGYSACHWCHVMERESFEDETTAALMNELFVNVKVDREERPDLDQIYMTAVQGLTGHGGWPMTVFLTPDGKPFYGGTYFPPTDRGTTPAFQRVLLSVSHAYQTERDKVRLQAERVATFIQQQLLANPGPSVLNAAVLDAAAESIARQYDGHHGGFSTAPKFPQPMALDFLLRHAHRTGRANTLAIVEHTLQKMAHGGIYDHLGGGFHRYSVDAQWLVPHFEKMLYDNALLARVYLHAFQVTGAQFYQRIAEETLDYVRRDLADPGGGFYSTEDADSEGVEGKFYIWPYDEFRRVTGPHADLLEEYFGVWEHGNFEGQTILTTPEDVEAFALQHGVSLERLAAIVAQGRENLLAARRTRVRPGRDDKIIASWNGLMLRTFAEAARILGRAEDRETARANAAFLLGHLWQDGHLHRIFKDGQAKIPGYLEDYAGVADGLVALYEATFEPRWFRAARDLATAMLDQFWDEASSTFFDAPRDGEPLVARPRDLWDNATPSGTSLACHVLLRLWALTGEADYERIARTVLTNTAYLLGQHGLGFGNLLSALDLLLAPPQEVAVIGEPDAPDTRALLDVLDREYLPNTVVASAPPGAAAADPAVPLLVGRGLVDEKAAAYVCHGFVCELPSTGPSALLAQLSPRSAGA